MAARFNVELSRAVRYEAKRSEAAEKIISMHKRHGEVVAGVLKETVAKNAAQLVGDRVDNSSLLSLVLGLKHREYQSQPAAEPDRNEQAGSGTATSSDVQPPNAALAKVEGLLQAVLSRFESAAAPEPAPEPVKKRRKKVKPGRRDTVIFAAVVAALKGPQYCSFLDKHGIKPKWSESGHATYLKSYLVGDPWRKKVQDEKTRAKLRMQDYPRSELATAINKYLPKEFDEISPLLAQLAPRE